MDDTFAVRLSVRSYEIDMMGHVNNVVYFQYAEHARMECVRAAGVAFAEMHAAGLGPVLLETTIRFLHELRGGDEVTVSCAFIWGEGKSYRVEHEFRRDDGTLVAEVSGVCGLLDLKERRLVPDPGDRWRALAASPHVLGL